jgi:serine/threonine-protein kinase
VFRAFDPDGDRLVAVKAFRLDLAPELVHRLVAEFDRLIAAGLTHPSAIAPLASGIDGVTAYLAQQYVAAESLDLTLRRGPLTVADSLRISTELAGALDAAAALHILHGVLHPRDVLLASDDTKLTGLGIARAVERVGGPSQIRRPYTAPERGSSGVWDRRADVFGLAAITHEMLWRHRIVGTGGNAVEDLTEIPGADLSELRAVFARALAEDPTARFETAGEFVAALADAFSIQSVLLQPGATYEDVRLPLERDAEEPEPPALILFEPEPSRFDAIEADAEPDVEAVPQPSMEAVPQLSMADAEIPPVLPLQLIEPRDHEPPDTVLVETRSRSGISPIAFALLIGGAIGFAAGFGVGTWGRSPDSVPSDTSTVANATATTGPGRDFTEASLGGATRKADPAPAGVTAEPGTPTDPTATGGTSPAGTSPAAARSPAHSSPSLGSPGTASDDGVGDRARVPSPVQIDQKTAAAPIVGTLLVRSTPMGARVVVDGREYGRTPVTVGSLSRGVHKVRVVRDGYVPDDRQVTVTSAQRTHSMTVRLAPQRVAPTAPAAAQPAAPSAAPLTIESRPAGATVFLDGHPIGTTPAVVPDVAGGTHAVDLELEGYRRWSSTIHVVTSEKNKVTASLDR